MLADGDVASARDVPGARGSTESGPPWKRLGSRASMRTVPSGGAATASTVANLSGGHEHGVNIAAGRGSDAGAFQRAIAVAEAAVEEGGVAPRDPQHPDEPAGDHAARVAVGDHGVHTSRMPAARPATNRSDLGSGWRPRRVPPGGSERTYASST